MTVLALQLALLLLAIGNLGRLPIAETAGKQAPFLVNDFVILGILVIAAAEMMRRRTFRIDWTAGLGILFAIVGFISAVLAMPRFGLSGFELLFSLAYLARWMTYFALYIAAVNLVRRSNVRALVGAFDAGVLIFAIFGIFQAAFLPGFAQLVYPESVVYADWDPQGHRLVSTFLDPNYAGALLVIGLLLYAGRIASGAKVPLWRVAVLLTALLLTISRSSFLALGAGLVVVIAVRGVSARVLKIAGLLTLLALPAVPSLVSFATAFNKLSVDASALQRFVAWSRALRVFGDSPILGVGFNTYGFVGRYYGFDASGTSAFALDGGLIFIAVMTGVVGLTIFLGMLGTIGWNCRAVWRDAGLRGDAGLPADAGRGREGGLRADAGRGREGGLRAYAGCGREEVGVAVGVFAATVAILVHSLFVNSLILPFLMEPLWVLWAGVAVVRREIGLPADAGRGREGGLRADAGRGGEGGLRADAGRGREVGRVAVVSFPRAA